jgi:multidrug efflux pump subunit AcrA (membrane-fusion protein)
MGRRCQYTHFLRQRAFDLWVVLAMMATFPILAHAGEAGFGPIPVVVGTVTEQQVATEVEVVGSVEPQLATTLSTEIAGFTQSFDLREGEFVQKGKTVVAQLKSTELEL